MHRPLRRLCALGALPVLLAACAAGSGGRTFASAPPGGYSVTPAPTSAASSAGPSSGSTSGARTSPHSSVDGSSTARVAPGRPPFTPAHVVVVVEENHSYADITSSTTAPYLHALASQGASLGRMYAVAHPSQPNYVAMFSGSTHGLTSDNCPQTLTGPTLATQLAAAHRSFTAYSEGLPAAGSPVCTAGSYARKHEPWTDFRTVHASVAQPMTSFPTNFATLPSVSFVVPNLVDDMHDGTVAQGDQWLKVHLGAYATWARTHDSLLVVTWDEDDHSANNQIPTIVYGAHVRAGIVRGHSDHFRVLRTIEWLFGLPGIGQAAHRTPITGLFG